MMLILMTEEISMAKQWQTFVRQFEDMKEGERKLFIKDLSPGPRKYDTKLVRALIKKSSQSMPDVLVVRSESGETAPQAWSISILEELSPWVPGKPWEDLFKAVEKIQGEK